MAIPLLFRSCVELVERALIAGQVAPIVALSALVLAGRAYATVRGSATVCVSEQIRVHSFLAFRFLDLLERHGRLRLRVQVLQVEHVVFALTRWGHDVRQSLAWHQQVMRLVHILGMLLHTAMVIHGSRRRGCSSGSFKWILLGDVAIRATSLWMILGASL